MPMSQALCSVSTVQFVLFSSHSAIIATTGHIARRIKCGFQVGLFYVATVYWEPSSVDINIKCQAKNTQFFYFFFCHLHLPDTLKWGRTASHIIRRRQSKPTATERSMFDNLFSFVGWRGSSMILICIYTSAQLKSCHCDVTQQWNT